MTLEGLPVLAATVIAIVLAIWLWRVVKETLVAAFGIGVILAVLFFGFGVTPMAIVAEIANLPANVMGLARSLLQRG
ncbi:MAG: hypothetical protein AAFY57_07200 [Cyanobacteria bacterium J06642_2]